MATATVTTVKKTVETEVSERVVKLELTPDEAEVLHTLVNRVRGDLVYTNRKYTEAIARALRVAGVSNDDCCHFGGGTIVAS